MGSSCRRGSTTSWCTGVCCARRGSGGSGRSGRGILDEQPLNPLKFLWGPGFGPILCLLADLADEFFCDWRGLVAPLVAHISKNSRDLFILEHFTPRSHHVVELLAFHGHGPMKSMQDDVDDVIVAMPVLREHPLTTGEWWKLARHPQTVLLVANSAVLRKDALADNHRIGRRRRAASPGPIPGHASRIEDIHAETSAIPKQIPRTQKCKSEEADNQPGWQQLRSFTGRVGFA